MIKWIDQQKSFNLRHGEPQAVQFIRSQGLNAFQNLGLPTKSNEEWKYTSLNPFAETAFQATNFLNEKKSQTSAVQNLESLHRQLQKIATFDAYRIVLVDGIIQPELSSLVNSPFQISTLIDALTVGDIDGGMLTDLKDPIEALNLAYFDQGLTIKVPKNTQVEKPVHIVNYCSNSFENHYQGAMSLPRFVIRLGNHSKMTLVETFIGNGDQNSSYFVSPTADIEVKENAQLEYVRMQQETSAAVHVGRTNVRVDQNGVFNSLVVELGSKLSRHQLQLSIQGEGVQSQINGIYSVGSHYDQHCDLQTFVDFVHGHSQVEQTYKGILDGSSKAVFNGRVLIRPDCAKASVAQMNKNLLLSSKAEIDSKPQLEIYNDDVKATHGATIGQLDANEIFYLMSRGISREKSLEMLSSGFLFELVDLVSNKSIQSMIKENISCLT